ncbi:hypothetical protein BH10ACI4_BH10ACI4_12690 [soil metagenome]
MRLFALRRMARLAVLTLLMTPAVHAQVDTYPLNDQTNFTQDTWHVSLSPYLWLAGLNGTVGIGGHVADVHQSFGDILGNIKVGFMGFGEVRRGRIGLLTDVIYLRVGDQTAVSVTGLPFAVPIKATADAFTIKPAFAYRAYANRRIAIDATAGLRYWHLDAKVAAKTGAPSDITYSGSSNWADLTAGGRFTTSLTPHIGAFFLGDAGGGGASPVWQIATGIGYQVGKRSTLQFGYRRLYFNRRADNAFILESTMQGLVVGATFKLK